MDESAKNEMRNYTTGAGFLILAVLFSVTFMRVILSRSAEIPDAGITNLVGSFLLILTGIILAVLKKRDLSAIMFLILGMIYSYFYFNVGIGGSYLAYVTGGFFVIVALILLTAKDKNKYLLCVIPLLMAVFQFLNGPSGVSTELWLVVAGIISIVSFYFAVAVSSEKISLPLGNILKADVATDFKTSGSVLGYLLFGLSCASYAFYYLSGTTESYENILALDSVVGFMLIVTGILLFAIANMRFTPAMFIILGFLTVAAVNLGNGLVFVPIGVALIILGIIALLRTESRILPAVMLIVYGLTYFCVVFFSGAAGLSVVQGILNLIPCLIAVYLAFAVFSQSKKLKLF